MVMARASGSCFSVEDLDAERRKQLESREYGTKRESNYNRNSEYSNSDFLGFRLQGKIRKLD